MNKKMLDILACPICKHHPLEEFDINVKDELVCLLYTSPSPRDATLSRMPSSA